MSIQTGGAGPQQQIYQSELTQGQIQERQEALPGIVRMINEAAGAPTDKNFLDNASLDALMLAIMTDRAEMLESTLREQVNEVRTKNAKLKEANSMMAKARAASKGSSEDDETKMPKEVINFFASNNIPWGEKGGKIDPNSSHELNSSQWELAIENMKGWSESLTSSSQLDMTKLQSTSGKFNQTFEMMSQFISKYFRSGDSLIKNI